MKFLSWLISLPFLVVCVLFAVNNRQEVTIDCWPFDYDIKTPLFVVTLGGLLLGILLGSAWVWFGSLRTHLEKRKLTKEVDKLKTKLNEDKPV
ncbi:MAG: lipopolysaccharide assembly protein LapA domain-containing protein [Alphaproteobacteria bacterium]|nr:lipopolysaccharide assembly protein LapA domain-containing protein [Alphaproteobacteria bacterium]